LLPRHGPSGGEASIKCRKSQTIQTIQTSSSYSMRAKIFIHINQDLCCMKISCLPLNGGLHRCRATCRQHNGRRKDRPCPILGVSCIFQTHDLVPHGWSAPNVGLVGLSADSIYSKLSAGPEGWSRSAGELLWLRRLERRGARLIIRSSSQILTRPPMTPAYPIGEGGQSSFPSCYTAML
jgi:hypothetical protein